MGRLTSRKLGALCVLQAACLTPTTGFGWFSAPHASRRRPIQRRCLSFGSKAAPPAQMRPSRKRPFALCGTMEGGKSEDAAEIFELTEEEALEEWTERGLVPAKFSIDALVAIWEAEDSDSELDEAAINQLMEEAPLLSELGDPESEIVLDEDETIVAEEDGAVEAAGEPIGKAVGIDLGTTNSAIAFIQDGRPLLVPNPRGSYTTPSVVAYRPISAAEVAVQMPEEARLPGEHMGTAAQTFLRVLVGEAAQAEREKDAADTFASVKRVIGRTPAQVRKAGLRLKPLGVDTTLEGVTRLHCPIRSALNANNPTAAAATAPAADSAAAKRPLLPYVLPEEISAEILRALIADAEYLLGEGTKVRRAVVAVPAYFNAAQCAATEAAGKLAGLEKVKVMREPEAAALAYGLNLAEDELVLVFDLGGGTFDVSVVAVGGGIVEVVATAGDAALGGDDLDAAIAEGLAEESIRQGKGDPRADPRASRRLLEAARAARVRLSASKVAAVAVPLAGGGSWQLELTRPQMEAYCSEPLKRMLAPLRQVAIMADVSLPGETGAFVKDLRGQQSGGGGGGSIEAILSDDGGGSNAALRKLRQQQTSGRRNARAQREAARRQAGEFTAVARLLGTGGRLRSFPQGRPLDRVVLVGGGTKMPCVQRLIKAVTGVEPQKTVDPDAAVALGAAVFAGIVEGELEGMDVLTAWQAAVLRGMARAAQGGAGARK